MHGQTLRFGPCDGMISAIYKHESSTGKTSVWGWFGRVSAIREKRVEDRETG